MDIKSKLYQCLVHRNFSGAQIFLSVSSLIMSLMILLPVDRFTGLPFTVFIYNFPDYIWGINFLCYSLLGFLNISIKQKYNKITKLELIESYYGFFLWSILTSSIFYSSHTYSATLAPLIAGTLLSWWVLIRTCLNNDRY